MSLKAQYAIMESFRHNRFNINAIGEAEICEVEVSREATSEYPEPQREFKFEKKVIKPDVNLDFTKISLDEVEPKKKLIKAPKNELLQGLFNDIPEKPIQKVDNVVLSNNPANLGVNLTEESLKYLSMRKRAKKFNRAVIKNLLPEFDRIADEGSGSEEEESCQVIYDPNNLNYGEGVYLRQRIKGVVGKGDNDDENSDSETNIKKICTEKYGREVHQGKAEHADIGCVIM